MARGMTLSAGPATSREIVAVIHGQAYSLGLASLPYHPRRPKEHGVAWYPERRC